MNERDILATELKWGAVVAAAVGLILGVIVVSSVTMALHPPSNVEIVDPATLHINGEFVESNLGTQMGPDGSITARLVATQFAFVPRCIAVPAGRPVTIRVVSPDVIHGLLITGTNVNTMVIPGYVSQVRTVFQRPGDRLMPCHEYCGLGHSEMWNMVRVVSETEWKVDEHGRAACNGPG